jgi:hypothetical protein
LRATHVIPQRVSELHPLTHSPLAVSHTGVMPERVLPQAPQFKAVSRGVSQPFMGLPSQSPKPGLHVKPHTPLLHVAVAFAGTGQAFPQRPQLRGSLSTLPQVASIDPSIPASCCTGRTSSNAVASGNANCAS